MEDKYEESLKEAAQKWIKQRKCKEVKWKRQTLKSDGAAVPAQPEPRELLVNGVLIWRR